VSEVSATGEHWSPIQIGEGFEGGGDSVAHVNTILGDRSGPVGAAWATALATPSQGHAPFLVVARPGLPVKPFTLFVNKSPLVSEDHANLTWGAAQAGIASGVVEAVRSGLISVDVAESAVIVAAVWVSPKAGPAHQDAIFINNEAAMLAAIRSGTAGRPTAYEVVSDTGGIWNPFFQP
jgi:5,6,7,8-tetrahydromethanopterin hydro-lyase